MNTNEFNSLRDVIGFTSPKQRKKIVQQAFYATHGEAPKVVEIREIDPQPLAPGETRVKILRSPINPSDIAQIGGVYGLQPPLPAPAGMEGIGEVTEVNGEGHEVGTLVLLSDPPGAWVTERIFPSDTLVPVPHADIDQLSMFTAKLTPSEGKLEFDVNFYGRGLFPPGAFHSEGHQDGMGVCLYLALMKRLLGDGFSIALLDDVVMSVDADHRRQFCQLLKSEFPKTQFIIATHDRVWAEQMKRAGLVTGKTSLAFHSWSVETGPLVESNAEIWEDISRSLDRNKVETAAHTLRRHLEFAFGQLADNISAPIAFRTDGNYDLGDFLPSTVGQLRILYSRASEASQSWNDQDGFELVKKRKDALKEANKYKGEEDWVVNRAVHHNEWANFGKNDFTPVVEAFKRLISCFQCENCGSYLEVTPRGQTANALRCQCSKVNLNLVKKK